MGGTPNQSKRDAKRLSLGLWKMLHELVERSTQLLGRCERELHLRLDSDGPGDPKLACSLNGVLQQRGLADARLSMHHQHAAVPGTNAV